MGTIVVAVNILIQIGIQKTLEFGSNHLDLLLFVCNKRMAGVGSVRFFSIKLLQHLGCPVLTQRNCLNEAGELPVKLLFTDKGLETLPILGLFRAAVIDVGGVTVGAAVVLGVEFRRHHHATLATTKKSGVKLDRPFLVPRVTAPLPDLLYCVKQFLCNQWLVRTFVDFATIPKMTIVEWIGENKVRNAVLFPHYAVSAEYPMFRQKVSYIHDPIGAGGKHLECLLNNRRFLAVNDNSFCARIVHIPSWCHAGHNS